MTPVRHKSNNAILHSPHGWESDVYGECKDLYVTQNYGTTHSYWRPSLKERLRIALGMPVRLGVFAECHPPVTLDANN